MSERDIPPFPVPAAAPVPREQINAEVRGRARDSARLVLRGIVLNLLLVGVKFAGGVFGNTYALIADAIESLLDVISSFLVWLGLRVAARPPDADHPYGHGKAEAIAGLAVSLALLVAAGWVGVHAVAEIRTPHQGPHWATLPLLVAIVGVKYWFSRRLVAAGQRSGSTAVGIEAWHHYADALTSAAAFVGIAVAVWGGKGYETADDWAALLAAVVIAWNGVSLARKALDDVMDGAAPVELEQQLRTLAHAVAGVEGLDKCRIRKSGLSYLVDLHVEVDGRLSVTQGHDIAGAVKRALITANLRVSDVNVHIEPATPGPKAALSADHPHEPRPQQAP